MTAQFPPNCDSSDPSGTAPGTADPVTDPATAAPAGTSGGASGGTPLRTPAGLWMLREALGSDAAALAAADAFTSWEHLVTTPPMDRARLLGPGAVTLPAAPPRLPRIPNAVSLLTPLQFTYPQPLRHLNDRPAVLFVAGSVPAAAMVGMLCAPTGSTRSADIARAAGSAAAAENVALVVPFTPGSNEYAIRAAHSHGGRVVAVLPYGFGVPGANTDLLHDIIEAGGAVITRENFGHPSSLASRQAAEKLTVQITTGVLLTEVGFNDLDCLAAVRAAVTYQKTLIVPAKAATGPGAAGNMVFTDPRMFDPEPYGSSPRIDARRAAGLPAADHVVADASAMAAAFNDVAITAVSR